MVNRPHALAYAVGLLVVVGIVVAATVESKEPVWALSSSWVYRAEVGAAFVGLLYLPLVALTLAWRGQTFTRLQAPGGAGVEAPADEVDSAAKKLDDYAKKSDAHLARLESALATIDKRVERLERSKDADD